MSKDYTYTKQVNRWKLEIELKDASFLLTGLSYDEKSFKLVIKLNDSETKDPTSIVNAHVYTATPIIDWKAKLSGKTKVEDKVTIIGKYLGLIPLDSDEKKTGNIK